MDLENETDPAPDTQETEALEVSADPTDSESGDETPESAAPLDDKDKGEEFELIIEGDEPSQQQGAKENKAFARLRVENEQLKREMEALRAPPPAQDPGPEPTLEDCEFDQDVFKTRYRDWINKNAQKTAAEAEANERANAARRAWQEKLDKYAVAKGTVTKQIPDYADRETAVQAMLNPTQQGIVLHGAENPAYVIAALGQSPKLAKKFADLKDPVAFAVELGKLEVRLKMKPKTTPTTSTPDRPVRGTGQVAGSVDSQLEILRAEAAKTNDNSKVDKYLRDKRNAARGK